MQLNCATEIDVKQMDSIMLAKYFTTYKSKQLFYSMFFKLRKIHS